MIKEPAATLGKLCDGFMTARGRVGQARMLPRYAHDFCELLAAWRKLFPLSRAHAKPMVTAR